MNTPPTSDKTCRSDRDFVSKGIMETIADGQGIAWLHKHVGSRIDSICRFCVRNLVKLPFLLLPVKRDKIVFRSSSNNFGGDLGAIAQKISRLPDKYDMAWLINAKAKCKDYTSFPNYIRLVDGLSLRALYDFYTARVVLDAAPRRYRRFSKKQQFYIQARRNSFPWAHHLRHFTSRELEAHTKTPDICIVGNEFEIAECRNYYGNLPSLLRTGHPRNKTLANLIDDPTSNLKDRTSICKHYEILDRLDDIRFALFVAPELTSLPDCTQILNAIRSRFTGDWMLLIISSLPEHLFSADIRNVRSYSNKHRLMNAADILITDGTGWTFDYVLSERPIFLFEVSQHDVGSEEGAEAIDDKERFDELYIDWSHSQGELCELIQNFDAGTYQDNCRTFLRVNKFQAPSMADEKIANTIQLLCKPGITTTEIYKRSLAPKAISAHRKLRRGLRGILSDFANGFLIQRLYNYAGKFIDKIIKHVCMAVCRLKFYKLPIKNNKIVFRMFQHKYGCNLKYITEELIRQKLPYDLVWIVDFNSIPNIDSFPPQVRLVQNDTVRAWREMATAKIIVDNNVRKVNPKLKPEQRVIQTWHGSLGLKRFSDVWDKKITDITNELTDYCVSNSSFETEEVYRRTFWSKAKILEVGHPRNDLFFWASKRQKALKQHVRSQLGIAEEYKILLYAPTFREMHVGNKEKNNNLLKCYALDAKNVLAAIRERFGGEWLLLVRLHYHLRAVTSRLFSGPGILNVSGYDDIQELMLLSEAMITDYSSCIFDFLLTRKPGFIFASDLGSYQNERDFYYPIKSTPFPIALNSVELCNNIKNFDAFLYQQRSEEFLRERGCVESGQASERVVELITDIIDTKERL